jgi:uncharacterized surface anchored protein
MSAVSLALLGLLVTSSGPAAGSLPGSNFEIDTDANLTVDGAAPAEDWISVPAADENRQEDEPTGANDDSFGQGTKEDTAVPTVVDGSIPNNKSDLRHFGAYLETTTVNGETERFLNVFWHRVQEPTGTTNMDFEFNKSTTTSGNGVTPVRSAGDVLIQYDLSQGGTNPTLWLSRWVTTGPGSQCQANNATPCWGTRVNLSAAGDATGSINTSPITAANSDGLGAMSARTFGEAQIDFDALAGTDACTSFGSAYLKSRSSDSFTAALKDFIAPVPLDFNICGSVHVIKHDDATPPNLLDGAAFDLVEDAAPINNVGGPGAEDTNVVDSCVTGELPDPAADDGVCDFGEVAQGDYWVVETAAPPGHDLANPVYQHVTVVADEEVTVTFVDPRLRGAILITKTAKHAAAPGGTQPQADVEFSVEGQAANVTTNDQGQACVGGLLFGDYDVTELVPAGYHAAGPTTKTVTVDQAGTCASGAETVSFVNTPLTDLDVTVDSQITGGTDTIITCTPPGAPDGVHNTDATGDGTLSLNNLEPGTYDCKVVIDP